MGPDAASPPPSPTSSTSSASSAPSSPTSNSVNKSGKPKKCRFNDCDNLAVDGTSKCAFHKNRRQCCVENCTNQVYARKLCVRHGGKKQCQADNCEAHARGGGYCLQHGGFVVKRFCLVEGCSKQAHARQKCVRHGGGRRCKIDGCMQHARAGGLCNRHSHGHECRIDGCNKTAQHSGSICFRHAMELRAHGEEVPELNISKGGRLSSKKRQQLQREQQLKQEQFHHQQLQQHHQQQQQQHQHQLQPQQQQQHQQQQQQQQHQQQQQQSQAQSVGMYPMTSNSTTSTAPAQSSSAAAPGPFGLPLKINVPTNLPNNIPKLTMRTPLGGFPTPRSHDFSLLMGLPSPQIDPSQLPSVLAMSNAQRSMYENSSALANTFLSSGPPSISRGAPRNPFLSPTGEKSSHNGSHVDEDIDAFINTYQYPKFLGTPAGGAASPIAYQHNHANQYAVPSLLENINLNVFDHTTNNNNNGGHQNGSAAMSAAASSSTSTSTSVTHGLAINTRNHFSANSFLGPSPRPRFKGMEGLTPLAIGGDKFFHGFDGFPMTPADGSGSSSDYTAQFFADPNQLKMANDNKGRTGASPGPASAAATTAGPKPTGVTAA